MQNIMSITPECRQAMTLACDFGPMAVRLRDYAKHGRDEMRNRFTRHAPDLAANEVQPCLGAFGRVWAHFGRIWGTGRWTSSNPRVFACHAIGDLARATRQLVESTRVTIFGKYRCHQPRCS